VRELLIEAAGVRLAPAPVVEEEGEGEAEVAGDAAERAAEAARRREREALDRAHRRGVLVAALDAAAIVVLLLLREGDRFLVLARTEEAIFSLGVLVVAVHLGFRLAQVLTVATVRRLHQELAEREE
jgi:hypothetical protein